MPEQRCPARQSHHEPPRSYSDRVSDSRPPQEFVSALMSLRHVASDPSLSVSETAAPARLAPYAAAIQVVASGPTEDPPAGTGTLVVLYDPAQTEVWGAPFRLVGHARMQIDSEQSTDPLLGEAIWHTLADSLDAAGAGFSRMVGSVTREVTETFGGLELQGSALNAELRCSWTPNGSDLGEHLEGWMDALRQNCGLEPSGIVPLGSAVGQRTGE